MVAFLDRKKDKDSVLVSCGRKGKEYYPRLPFWSNNFTLDIVLGSVQALVRFYPAEIPLARYYLQFIDEGTEAQIKL